MNKAKLTLTIPITSIMFDNIALSD